MMRTRLTRSFMLALVGLCLAGGPAYAARLVQMWVQSDGKRVLQGWKADDGFPGDYLTWRYLKDVPLKQMTGADLKPEPDRPLEVILRGDIVVKVGDWSSQTSELKLTRQSAESDSWYVDPAWVEANGPPGDAEEAAQKLTSARQREAFQIYSTLAVMVGVGLSFILGLISNILGFTQRFHRPSRGLAITALALALVCLVSSLGAHWYGTEALGGAKMYYPAAVATLVAGIGVALSARARQPGSS